MHITIEDQLLSLYKTVLTQPLVTFCVTWETPPFQGQYQRETQRPSVAATGCNWRPWLTTIRDTNFIYWFYKWSLAVLDRQWVFGSQEGVQNLTLSELSSVERVARSCARLLRVCGLSHMFLTFVNRIVTSVKCGIEK